MKRLISIKLLCWCTAQVKCGVVKMSDKGSGRGSYPRSPTTHTQTHPSSGQGLNEKSFVTLLACVLHPRAVSISWGGVQAADSTGSVLGKSPHGL